MFATLRRVLALVLVMVTLVACAGGGGVGTTRVAVQKFIAGATNADEIRAIWGELPTVAQESVIARALRRADDQGFVVLRGGETSAASQIETALLESEADVITVVGHNVDGHLQFADESTIPIARLGEFGPTVAVISCSSKKYVTSAAVGIPNDLALDVAMRTDEILQSRLAALDPSVASDPARLRTELEEAFDQASAEFPDKLVLALSITGLTGTAVVGIHIVAVELD